MIVVTLKGAWIDPAMGKGTPIHRTAAGPGVDGGFAFQKIVGEVKNGARKRSTKRSIDSFVCGAGRIQDHFLSNFEFLPCPLQ